MRKRIGRTLNRFRFPFAGSRTFLLPTLILSVLLCACLSGQTSNLSLPHPIPPPAEEDPPAAQRKPSAPTVSSPSRQRPPVPATSTGAASGPSVLVNPKPLRDSSGNVIPMNGSFGGGPVYLPASYTAKPNEFRGVWVATSFNLDFAKQATAAEFQRSFRTLASNVASMGFNTIMFQVRPNCDAFYKSSINPWSRWLTGEEGRALDGGFDPMAFMIAESHRQGLKFYAWLNPYRVGQVDTAAASAYLKSLSAGNFARRNPELVARWKNAKTNRTVFFLDPGRSEVVTHIVGTVREILERYKPDGIVFDDYFYPDGCDAACDAATFRKYGRKGQSLADWRRANTELMVRSVAGTVRAFNKLNGTSIPFGVSPVGIWANRTEAFPEGSPTVKGVEAYTQSYIDVRKWVRNSWIDFVIPQVNWGFANSRAPFAGVVNWWADQVRGTNVKLYIGIGVYQAGAAAGMESPSELSNQILYLILLREVSGSAFFAFRHCLKPENNAQKTSLGTIFGTYWRTAPSAK